MRTALTRRRALLCAAIATLLLAAAPSVTPAAAGYRGLTDAHMASYLRHRRVITIDHGIGGHVQGTLRNLSYLVQTGKRVVINGPCQSACTLFLSLGPERVCVTRRAELWFHQAVYRNGKRSRYWSEAMLKLYPGPIRRYIRQRGGLRKGWIVVKGKSLRRLYPYRCR